MRALYSRFYERCWTDIRYRLITIGVFLAVSALALIPVNGGAAEPLVAQWFDALHFPAGGIVFLLFRWILPANESSHASYYLAFIASLVLFVGVEAAQSMTGRSVDAQDIYRGVCGAVVVFLVSSYIAPRLSDRWIRSFWRMTFLLLALPALFATVAICLFFRMISTRPELCDFELPFDQRLWSIVHGPTSARPRMDVVDESSSGHSNHFLKISVAPPGWGGVSILVPKDASPDARDAVVSVDAYSFDEPFDLYVRCFYESEGMNAEQSRETRDEIFRLAQPKTRLTICSVSEPGKTTEKPRNLLTSVWFFGFGVQAPNTFGLDNLRFSTSGFGKYERN